MTLQRLTTADEEFPCRGSWEYDIYFHFNCSKAMAGLAWVLGKKTVTRNGACGLWGLNCSFLPLSNLSGRVSFLGEDPLGSKGQKHGEKHPSQPAWLAPSIAASLPWNARSRRGKPNLTRDPDLYPLCRKGQFLFAALCWDV